MTDYDKLRDIFSYFRKIVESGIEGDILEISHQKVTTQFSYKFIIFTTLTSRKNIKIGIYLTDDNEGLTFYGNDFTAIIEIDRRGYLDFLDMDFNQFMLMQQSRVKLEEIRPLIDAIYDNKSDIYSYMENHLIK